MTFPSGLLPKGRPRYCWQCEQKSSVTIISRDNRTYPICDNGHDFTEEWIDTHTGPGGIII